MSSSEKMERAIADKVRMFQEHVGKGRWEELVNSCYASHATLSHFTAPEQAFSDKESILAFFRRSPTGYNLDLRYAITQLVESSSSSTAWLVAGVGSVDQGPWCCFAERWEMINGDFLIVEDKVYAPESWMK